MACRLANLAGRGRRRNVIVFPDCLEIAFARLINVWAPYPGRIAKGLLQIGDYRESFLAPLDRFSRMDYMEQWASAVRHILTTGGKSALLTSYRGGQEIMGEWWPLYRVGNRVLIQNHLILTNVVGAAFNPRKASAFVSPHRSVDEEGCPISEWSTTLPSLQAFYRRLQLKLERIRLQRGNPGAP